MAKNLKGAFESVPFHENESLLMYINTENADFDTHWHPAAELIMPIENGYQVTIGRQVYRLKERDILFIPPGELHSLQAPPGGKRMVFLFNFTPICSLRDFSSLLPVLAQPMLISHNESNVSGTLGDAKSGLRTAGSGSRFADALYDLQAGMRTEDGTHRFPDREDSKAAVQHGNGFANPSVKDVDLHAEIERLLQRIIDIYPDRSEPLRVPMIYSYLIQFFVCLGRHRIRRDMLTPDSKTRRQSDCYERLNASLNFINSNYMNDISVEDAARAAGFSKFHFSRLFKQFTEQTFCEYLNQRRISAAETLLLNPRLSVTDVALQSGFSSLSTFNRTFRALKSCTPSEFKAYHQRRGLRIRRHGSSPTASPEPAMPEPAVRETASAKSF